MQDNEPAISRARRKSSAFASAIALISRIKNTLFLIRGLIEARDAARAAGLLEEVDAHERTLSELNRTLDSPDLFEGGEIAEA